MSKNIQSLMLYTNGYNYEILNDFIALSKKCSDSDACRAFAGSVASRILSTAIEFGFKSDAWQSYITLLIITSDNVFSRCCERRKIQDCTLTDFAMNDIKILYDLFFYDFSEMENNVALNYFSSLKNYRENTCVSCIKFPGASQRLNMLTSKLQMCKNADEFFDCICKFYEKYGFGNIGLNKSFRFDFTAGHISFEPVINSVITDLEDIIGYESQKQQLYANTKAFIDCKPANNVLLYGDSGTGKSTSIKAIADEFYEDGLRMIEVYKHQIERLPSLISFLSQKNYRFIIYLDDLSFEETETEYKYLKAVIDGGTQCRPENVLIYATSNRRHLIKETWKDRADSMSDDIHSGDTLEEKLSLASRFGLTIYYPKPGRDEYMNIVEQLAVKNNIDIDLKTLYDKARVWEMHHGGISGRTAAQFIAYLLGNQ